MLTSSAMQTRADDVNIFACHGLNSVGPPRAEAAFSRTSLPCRPNHKTSDVTDAGLRRF